MKTEEIIAEILLETGAVKLRPDQPFKWASGWNSPIYCGNRYTLSFPEKRKIIKEKLVEIIKKNYPSVEGIAGVATAGIAQGALVAEALELPFVYVRPKPKDHGMENLIEGKIVPGQKVVVIEDLISTGGSSLKATEALKDAGFDVLGMAAIFTYGFSVAEENFKNAGIKLATLGSYDSLVQTAVSKKYIKQDEVETLTSWRKDPGNWKK